LYMSHVDTKRIVVTSRQPISLMSVHVKPNAILRERGVTHQGFVVFSQQAKNIGGNCWRVPVLCMAQLHGTITSSRKTISRQT
jgi:hypothetical protein